MLLMQVNGSMMQIHEGIGYVAESASQAYSMPPYLTISRLYSLTDGRPVRRIFYLLSYHMRRTIAQGNLLGEERLCALSSETEALLVR
jgi:hypothetical protein